MEPNHGGGGLDAVDADVEPAAYVSLCLDAAGERLEGRLNLLDSLVARQLVMGRINRDQGRRWGRG